MSTTLQSPARIRKRVQRLVNRVQALLALPSPSASDIHQLRRNTKKLRAWLKLWRDSEYLPDAQRIEALLRNNAARFSAMRDALVRLQTLEQLPALAGDKAATGLQLPQCRALLTKLMPHAATPAVALDLQELEQSLPQLLAAQAVPEQMDVLSAALRKTWRKARKRLQQAHASGTAEDLHAFRRWAKYLCYQLELVCVLDRGALAKLQRSLETLCSRLGSWHDLVVLEESLQVLRATTNLDAALQLELDQADRLCHKAQSRLLKRCLRMADTSFKGKAAKLPLF